MVIEILTYPIFIEAGLLQQKELFRKYITGKQVLIVTNGTIAPLYLEQFKAVFEDIQCDIFILPDGERHKNFQNFQKIIHELIDKRHLRSTTIIALGGGVVGDVAGFAASCYHRGVNFLQVPTSLLAQVDASIGGKTALNTPQAKNVVGSFYQPKAVFIDTATLKTLPLRQLRAGLAEMIKHALVADSDYFDWLEENVDSILKLDPEALQYAIQKSIEIKSAIVKEDERERKQRAILNFGHTIGHAVEAASGYQLLHGEAIAIGMMIELPWSIDKMNLPADVSTRIESLLKKAGLPTSLPESIDHDQLLPFINRDKKQMTDRIRVPLLRGIGDAVLEDLILFYDED